MKSTEIAKKIDGFINMKFNSWTVTGIINHRMVECICECGNVKQVSIYDLINNKSRRCSSCARKFRGKRTHGMSRTRIYTAWIDMKSRCYRKEDSSYENYGGRGITVCDEWKDNFEPFRDWALGNGYASHLSIDRKDNDGNYCPENCHWVTKQEQNNNTRRNHYVFYKERKYTLSQLAHEHDLKPTVVYKRLQRGWSIEEAIETKLNERRHIS